VSRLSWLHLSDWHQRGEDFDRQVVRDALLEDLRSRAETHPHLAHVDFVVFSGDAAFCGAKSESEAARKVLFDPVLEAVDLPPQNLFFVPGNHDSDRDVISDMAPELHAPLASEQLAN
jgi:3',5'-cyclic AMP phosphodiesterase CpdA